MLDQLEREPEMVSLLAGSRQHPGREVDPDDVQSSGGERKRVAAGAAPQIKRPRTGTSGLSQSRREIPMAPDGLWRAVKIVPVAGVPAPELLAHVPAQGVHAAEG
jgi:hypothetical protein